MPTRLFAVSDPNAAATLLGTYPIELAIFRTRSLVSAENPEVPLSTREAVILDTPASSATSASDTGFWLVASFRVDLFFLLGGIDNDS